MYACAWPWAGVAEPPGCSALRETTILLPVVARGCCWPASLMQGTAGTSIRSLARCTHTSTHTMIQRDRTVHVYINISCYFWQHQCRWRWCSRGVSDSTCLKSFDTVSQWTGAARSRHFCVRDPSTMRTWVTHFHPTVKSSFPCLTAKARFQLLSVYIYHASESNTVG